MAEQQLPDINIQINELPFDKETKNKLFYAFYDENPRKAFESIKGVPLNIKQAMFDIRGRIHRGEKYDIDDIVRAVPVEQRKPLSLTDETVVGTEKTGAIPSVKPKIPKVEEIESESIAKRAARIALGPAFSMTKSEEAKPKYKQKELVAPVSKKEAKAAPAPVPVPATAPPPVVAESKTVEPPAPLLSREEMESRYANYIKEQAEKAEKELREKQPKGKFDKGKDSTAKKYKDIQIQAEEIAAPPSPVIVLNPYKPGTPEYEAERKRSAQTPVEVVQGPAKSFSEGLGQAIEYSVEQVPKTAKAISKAAAASEPGGKEYVTKKELLESGKTMREPLARPELLVPGGDGRKDLTREFVRGTLEAVGGLTAPETIAVIAGTKGLGNAAGLATGVTRSALKAATSALSAYFTGQAGVSAYEKGKEAVELYEKGDYAGAARALGVASIDALFALMGAAHSGKKAKESFKEGYARGQRRRANVEAETEAKFRKKLEEDFEPVPGQPGMLRLKKKPAEVAAGELPAAGEPKPATAKERSIIEYYKEDPTGVYSKLVFDIAKKSAEIAQESKAKSPNESKIKKLGKELNSLDKQKAIIDRIRQEGKSEQPATSPPVVATEPAQPPLAISAEPPPVVEEAPVVEPPPVVEPTPPAAEPVKAAVEPTVKSTVAETFSTPGGAKITDITQTSPEGFTPGIDYIPETDFIFDVEGIGKFTVIPSTEKPGSFAIWPEGDIAPAAVVEGANAKEAFTSFIDKPAPEVKVEAPVTPTGATEAPPAPGVTAPTAKPPVEEPKAATEPPPPVVAAAPPMPVPAPAQPPAPPVEPKPVEKKSPPPERRLMIQRGMNDPVTVYFKDANDKYYFTTIAKVVGRKGYSGKDLSQEYAALRQVASQIAKTFKIPDSKAQELLVSYREAVIEPTKGMPKQHPGELITEPLSFKEFVEQELSKNPPLTPPSPSQPATPEPSETPVASKPPVESPKVATEPPQEYTPEADGKVYVWMDYIGSDGKLSRKPVFLSSAERSKVWISLLQHFGRLIDKERKLPESMRIYFTGGILPGGKLAKPNRNTPYTDINTSYVEDLAKAMKRDKGEPNYQERVDNAIQKLQSLFDIPATVPAEKPNGGTGKKTKKGEAPVPESPVEPAPTQPQPPIELTPKPPVTPSEPGGGPVAVKEKAPKQVEPSESQIKQEEKALEFAPLSDLPKRNVRISPATGKYNQPKYTATHNGETWHTNAQVLVKGDPPVYWKPESTEQRELNLKGIIPDESTKVSEVEPIAYKHWTKPKEGSKKGELVNDEAIIMSDGGSISGDYYRYVLNKVAPDQWKTSGDGRYIAYKDGKPVAVVMGLRSANNLKYNKESIALSLKERQNIREKELWEMSRDELQKRHALNYDNPKYKKGTEKNDTHEKIVAEAVLSGKPVPEYVVKGMGTGFRWVSDSIADKLYPQGLKEVPGEYDAYGKFEEKVKPIVLDYLERVREGENPGDIYEFVKRKLEPGPNPPGFTPAPPEIPKQKPKEKPVESPKSPEAPRNPEQDPEYVDYGKKVRVTTKIGKETEVREGTVERTLKGSSGDPVYEVKFDGDDFSVRISGKDRVEFIQPKPEKKTAPPAAETKKSPAKASEEIKADDIEEIGISGEGEIEFAYKGKRYQASPIFDGKGYRFYDMESGKNIGEFKKSSYLEDPKEALAEVLDADRQLKELSGDAETPEVKPEKSEVAPVETPKIQTKYIEPETPQYREGGELIALKLRADRDPVIYAKNTTLESLVRILYKNKFSAAAIKALGVNIGPSSNLHSIIQKILDSKNFNGSSSERELLEVFSKNLNEGKAKSKGGSVTIVNTDSLHRGVLVLPSAYEALKGSVKSGQVAKVAPVSSLIETLRHENVHSNTTSAIKKISQSDISKIGQDANFKKFQQILKKGGYSKADTDIYMAIDELAAHFLSGNFQFFSENGMTPEELADAYSLVRPYILAIDKDAVARAERFKKPGLKVSGSIKPSEGLSSTEKTMPMRGKEGGLSNIRYSLSTSNPPSASVVKKEFQEAGTPDKYSNTDKDDNFYYHVTTKPAANQIKKTGIFPRKSGGAMSPGFYSEYSKGKAFFSERSGVSYWADVISRHIENQTGKEPNLVVLRFPKDMAVDLEVDEVGSKDSGRPSYYVKGNILGEKYKSNPLSKENLKKYFLYHEDPSSGKRKVIATSETEQELKDERERIHKSGKYSSWNTKIAPSSSYEYYMNPSRR